LGEFHPFFRQPLHIGGIVSFVKMGGVTPEWNGRILPTQVIYQEEDDVGWVNFLIAGIKDQTEPNNNNFFHGKP